MGDALACHVLDACKTPERLPKFKDEKGKDVKKVTTLLVARFVEPLLRDRAVGLENARRVRLWLPAALLPGNLDDASTAFAYTLRGVCSSEKVRFCAPLVQLLDHELEVHGRRGGVSCVWSSWR